MIFFSLLNITALNTWRPAEICIIRSQEDEVTGFHSMISESPEALDSWPALLTSWIYFPWGEGS